MKLKNILYGFIPITLLTAAKIADNLFMNTGLNMAVFGIDDAILIGGALGGGILNLFGGNAEQEKWARYQRQLADQRLRIGKQYDEKLADMKRQASFMKKQRSVAAQQKAAEYGVNPQSIAYSAVEDIDNSLMNAEAMLEEQKSKALMEIDQMIEKANLMSPEEQTDIERFLEGSLTGVNLGSQIVGVTGGYQGMLGDATKTDPTVLDTKLADKSTVNKGTLENLSTKLKGNTPYVQPTNVTDALNNTYTLPTETTGFNSTVSTSPEQPGAQGMKGAFDFGLGDAKNLNAFSAFTGQDVTELLANADAGLGPAENSKEGKNNGFSFDRYFSFNNPDYYKYKNLYKYGLGKNFKF